LASTAAQTVMSRSVKAVTIVARNYLPQARVLAASFLHHHPTASFHTLIIDGSPDDRHRCTAGEVLLVDEIGLDDAEWQSMAAIYDVMEFATAVKPAALRHLLRIADDPNDAVAYIDPDIEFFAPIDDVFHRAVEHGIVLTPHVLEPMPRDGRTPVEGVIRHSGIFNLGFIAVSSKGAAFLDWWHERLRTDAIVDQTADLFTDQRWIDWVPALFHHHIERDPGLNVAYWNLHERRLTERDSGEIDVNGAPLRFFHFSGYDPGCPWWLSKHSGTLPRTLLTDAPLIARLCADYAASLRMHGWGDHDVDYAFHAAVNGTILDRHLRRAMRELLVTVSDEPSAMCVAPFDPARAQEFEEWLRSTVVGPTDAAIGPWEWALFRSRTDLQHAFADIDLDGARRYRAWLDHDDWALEERRRLRHPVATIEPLRRAEEREPGGWNVVGYHNAEMGVGEAGRRVRRALDAAGLASVNVGVRASHSRRHHRPGADVHASLHHRDTVYCINADDVRRVVGLLEHADRRRGDSYRVGLWFWELSTFPQHFARSAELLDEVWVASEFYRQGIQDVVDRPVRVVPLAVEQPVRPTAFRRSDLGLPDEFLISFVFDFNSIIERKNPYGVLEAYCAAFGPTDGAHLVLKSINGHRNMRELERLRWAVRHRDDIAIIDEYWSNTDVDALIELSDVFVSLHRSEGFGLNIAAAMAAGTAVVCTNYGGNLDFMDGESAMLVPARLVDVGHGNAPYPPDAVWAEPDLHSAAAHLRRLFDDRTLTERLAEAGRRRVLSTHSLRRSALDIAGALHPGLFLDHCAEGVS